MDTFKSDRLARHAESRGHQNKVKILLGLQGDLHGPPTAEAFAKVWDELRSGSSGRRGLKEVGAAKKLRRMFWCLWESMKALDRDFLLSDGTVIALHRDERRQRIQVRFSATNNHLETRVGGLGIEWNEGGAYGINKATEKIVMDFCTPLLGKPGSSAPCDTLAMKNILSKVEVVNVDAAPDELAAAFEAQHSTAKESAIMPHGRFTVRDKSHGARRTSG